MSLARLDTRVAHLEARRARTTSPSGLVVVWMADGDTRATALQKAGWTLRWLAVRCSLCSMKRNALMRSRLTTRLRRLEARCPPVADLPYVRPEPPPGGARRCCVCCATPGIWTTPYAPGD